MRTARLLDMLLLLQHRGRTTCGQLAEEADLLSTWFVHDPDPPTGNRISHGELRRIATCICTRRKVELTVVRRPTVEVEPLGLVLKAGSWNLIVAITAGVDVVCIDELRATRVTNRRFAQPAGFDLTRFWDGHAAHRS
jgi:predicted DNA-binding transcriptional regulator YafY